MIDKLKATDHAAGKTPLGEDLDGAGQAPDAGAKEVETDQTRAAAALEKQVDPVRVRDAAIEMISGGMPDPELRMAPLYEALAKAQGAFPEIPKNRTATIRPQTGQPWSFMYSDLSDLINATRPGLTSNGLAVFQTPDYKREICITTLAHASGLTLVGSYPVRHKDGGRMHPGQDWAISWAFARRYGMSALLGIAAEETVEGDKSEKTSPDFESAGGDGMLSVRGVIVPDGATKADKARIFAEAIEAQFKEAATVVGLDGVWKRNQEVINALQDHSFSNYANLLGVYETLKAGMEGEG
jgi:hypothetical protein